MVTDQVFGAVAGELGLTIVSILGSTHNLGEAELKITSTMDAYNYQWGYESIYEDDVISAAVAQLAAWKERLEMNAQVGYEEDAFSAAAAQLAAWKERFEMNVVISPTCNTCGATHSTEGCPFANEGVQYMKQYNYPQQNNMYSNTYNHDRWDYPNFLGSNDQDIQCPTNLPDFPQPMQQSENESALKKLMVQCIQTQTISLKILETLMGQMTNTLAQLSRQPEAFLSNTEPNPRHEDRKQWPSVTVRSEVQPEPQTQNAEELESSSYFSQNAEELESSSCFSQNRSPALPTTQSPCKQPSFNLSEEKAPQVELSTFPPLIRYVPPEPNSSYQVITTATINNIGVEEKPKKVGLFETFNKYITNNLTGKYSCYN
ncbi:hypothetical protein ACLOJK_008233 [Asimina triloba]